MSTKTGLGGAPRVLALATSFGVVALVAGACGQGASVQATLADFSITLDPSTAQAGVVSFDVTNDGPSVHEFVVFLSDLAPDQLPTDENGVVDESGEGLELIDEIEDIPAGSGETLALDLDAGSFVIVCNIPGHYGQGMHTGFTVT